MTIYNAPIQDHMFMMFDVLGVDKHSNIPGFEDLTPDLTNAVLEEAGKLASEVLHPLNQSGDEQGCTWDNGVVTTPDGFKEAYKLYCQSGWQSLTSSPDYGGQGLPQTLGLAVSEMMIASNWGFGMYPGLTKGATEAIAAHASDELKDTYLPKMMSGEWSGTMNLTEPHCGTDLGLLRTKAEPQGDGTFKVTGTKIFISAGEHDLTENIIHLVLAKIPGGPEGSRGISLFIVPKFILDADGNPGERNGVSCGSLEKKMGIHSNSTCVMNYDDAVGYLVGEEHKGLLAMFTMMNEARLGVGMQGLAIAEVAYQNAAVYTNERLQGRAISGKKNEDGPADPIIVHPDVRRMMMTSRAFTEGARGLALWMGLQVDLLQRHPDEDVREKAEDLVGLLTPVIKAYFTDMGVEVTSLSQQCYGGHGYIREHGMEQFARDARIAPIYEGTNGIQAMDLVGRKLGAKNGAAVQAFMALVQDNVAANADNDQLAPLAKGLGNALQHLQQATMWMMQNGMTNPDNAGAGAVDYLRIMALVGMGHVWLMQAQTAAEKLAEGGANEPYMKNKLITARFFFERMLPDTIAHLAKLEAGAESTMALKAEAF
ncbi:MAG: acyl-CoA dehydrogenase [Alphaproteobacteria bacterium]|nr:MAG: acyl-CoA dehydrogenase [Alphaproteobacteria bacterium]